MPLTIKITAKMFGLQPAAKKILLRVFLLSCSIDTHCYRRYKKKEPNQNKNTRRGEEAELLIYRFDLSSITSSFTMTFHPQNFGEEKICYFTKCEYSHSTFYRQGVPTSFARKSDFH